MADPALPSAPVFVGRHALVTGGSRGIGRAIAEALARRGARVSIIGRDTQSLATTTDALRQISGSDALALSADLSDPAALADAFAQARTAFGAVDILVNNAGIAPSGPFANQRLDDWNSIFAINLTAAYLGIQAVLPGMLERRFGRIVNIASTAGLTGYRYVAAYCAAKHGLVGLTRALALEYARSGITVNAVCPGFTDTDLVSGAVAGIVQKTGRSPDEIRAELVRGNPQGRLIQPEEVAAAVVFLADPAAVSMTGQAIAVAGGEVMP